MDHRSLNYRRSRSRSSSPPHRRVDTFRDDNRRNNNDFHRDNNGPKDKKRKLDRERMDMERRERMARMRAEIDAEERGVSSGNGGVEDNQKGDIITSNQKSNKKNEDSDEELDEEQRQMMQMMGFGGFGTTKGKSVSDNQTSAARGAAAKNKGRKYRQYMNRKGGFNRPLDKMA